MPAVIIYLLKAAITLAAFYLLYYLLFRREKQFTFNRYYLILAFLAGFLIPLITLKLPGKPVTYPFIPGPVVPPAGNSTVTVTANETDITGIIMNTLLYGYTIVGLFLVIRLLYGYFTIYRTFIRSSFQTVMNQEIYVTEKDLTPFSFFNRIVIPENLLSSPDLPAILEHEKVHITNWHSFDLLIAELLFIFQWFNPAAWFMKYAIRMNLEYIADHNVISEFSDIERYQMAMVRLADRKSVIAPVNALQVSQLKNRIIMMKRKNLSRYPVLRKLLAVPIVLMMVLLVSGKKYTFPVILNDDIIIKGKVTSAEDNKPLNRAAVSIKDKHIGTVTDEKGKYALRVNQKDHFLIYSMMGYADQEILIGNKKTINVRLKKIDQAEREKLKKDYDNNEMWKATGATDSLTGTIRITSRKVYITSYVPIKGKVVSSMDKTPLSSINVIIKGRPEGTITDLDGDYVIKVKKDDKTLTFIDVDGKYASKDININTNVNVDVNVDIPVEVNVELDPKN